MDVNYQALMQQLRQQSPALHQLIQSLYAANRVAQSQAAQALNDLAGMRTLMESMSIERSRTPDVYRIEDIPGRRIPWVIVFDIPIDANVTSVMPVSQPISQEGPFVCMRRWGVFQSAYEFQTTDLAGNVARINGRSYGRYRPIHSVCDYNDAQHSSDAAAWYQWAIGNGIAGDPLPSGVLSMPSNTSGFRTMQFDGRIALQVAGSTMPRQNEPIPSAFWTSENNGPVTLGALDFFTQGEVITARVAPTHANNPAAGNVDGAAVLPNVFGGGGPVAGWPFTAGQYDVHEGVATPNASVIGGVTPDLPTLLTTDSVNRLPVGILTLALEGYRIIQVAGAI